MALRVAGSRAVNWPRDSRTNLHQADSKADLRGVHFQIGYRDDTEARQTETKLRYVNHRGTPAVLDAAQAAELRKSHIDLAYGEDKTCRGWQAVMTSEMGRNADDKFGCKRPQGFQALGAELRKSSVCLTDRKSGLRQSEQKERFGAPAKFEQAKSFADSLGKELRESCIDIANGRDKAAKDWNSAMSAEMSRHAREKYECERPTAFEHLTKELRKSSLPLPGAR